jgi:hypothetical protein
MFGKIRALCLNSLTIAWSYCMAVVGSTLSVVDQIADALGDPYLRDQIGVAVGDARTTGRILLLISVVTIIARLRTVRREN